MKIPLRSKKFPNLFVIIDDADYERVNQFKWYVLDNNRNGKTFYALRHNKPRLLHRFLLNLTDATQHVDHINGNGLDCRRENLRIATRTENARNRRFTKNKTGYMGVYKVVDRYQASVRINGKNKSLGYFKTPEEASEAREAFARLEFGEFYKPL